MHVDKTLKPVQNRCTTNIAFIFIQCGLDACMLIKRPVLLLKTAGYYIAYYTQCSLDAFMLIKRSAARLFKTDVLQTYSLYNYLVWTGCMHVDKTPVQNRCILHSLYTQCGLDAFMLIKRSARLFKTYVLQT